MEERFLKSIIVLSIAGVLSEKHLKYLKSGIRENIPIETDTKNRVKIFNELIKDFVEKSLWNDRRFVKI